MRTKAPADGFRLAEGPRWHDGRLWISDIFARRAHTVALDGTVETVAEVPGRPSGLGFLPDGICLDQEGAIWVAAFDCGVFLRVLEGGAITHRTRGLDERTQSESRPRPPGTHWPCLAQ